MSNSPKLAQAHLPFLNNSKAGKRLAAAFKSNSRSARLVAPVSILLIIAVIVGGYFLLQALGVNDNGFIASGTIEATEIQLGSKLGGEVDRVNVIEGEKVEKGQTLVEVDGDRVRSPIDGVVLYRVVEPGEIATPGATLVTVSNLDALTLTVYVAEDRYGQILLGQTCQVTVDSFPGRTFLGTVSHIADQAEFTPRNVQTTESRKNTVFAIKLTLEPSAGLLKPGMPADVDFSK
jgi:multidrug resistance efflux pump